MVKAEYIGILGVESVSILHARGGQTKAVLEFPGLEKSK